MKNIVVIGASGHGKVIIDILHCMKKAGGINYDDIFLLDDDVTLHGQKILGHEILGPVSMCADMTDTGFVIAIGNNGIRKKIAEKYDLNYLTLIHPKAVVAEDVNIGAGTVVMAGAVVNSGTTVGAHCIINTSATVDHDTHLSDFVHLSPGVHMGGTVSIGEGSWIGVGGAVINNLTIGKNNVIGAGAVVIRDVGDNCKLVGNPARML